MRLSQINSFDTRKQWASAAFRSDENVALFLDFGSMKANMLTFVVSMNSVA